MFEFLYWLISGFHMIGLFMIDTRNEYSFFPGSPIHSRVIHGNILQNKKDEDTEFYFETIKNWAISQIEKPNISHHWWYSKLPNNIKSMFETISNHSNLYTMFSTIFDPNYYIIEPIYEMNEIYITGNERKNEMIQSDRVFFISHIDGPFIWIPFVSVYRCLIGINENNKITTHFPTINECFKINKGDALAFDFNREIHYISEKNIEDSEPRVTLKSHYCIYPKYLKWLGKIMYKCNAIYNHVFRNLFLNTIEPDTWLKRFNSILVVYSTHLFVFIETFIGYRNIAYLLFITYWNGIIYNIYTTYHHSILLYILPSIYKSISMICFYNDAPFIDKWSNIRDILLYYIVGALYLLYNNVTNIINYT